jgi:hypothetical protein
LSTSQKRVFTMISVPCGTDDIADAMISASQMIYASRMKFAVSSEWVDLISLDAKASNFTIHEVNYFTVSESERFH